MKKSICFITAVPGSASAFLRDHMSALMKVYEVYYACSEPDEQKIDVAHNGYQCVDIQRSISFGKDLKAVWNLYRYFRRMKFDAVHSVTPKAGLVTALAAYFAGVPHRTHIFTGQVWANKRGFSRWLLKTLDKVIAKLNNHILVDGEGQRQFLIQQGVLSEHNSKVLGQGSICGVNLERFNPTKEMRETKRKELNVSEDTIVFSFMGRLNHDKGLYELLPAFNRLVAECPKAFLVLYGNDEENVASHFGEYNNLKEKENFLYYGLTREPQNMTQAADVFVLPTYREGFGSSVIEAAALGIPTICSDAYGVMDAMVDNVTGLRCQVGDEESLYYCMKQLYNDKSMRERMGKAGRERVLQDFDGRIITQKWVEFYHEMLK